MNPHDCYFEYITFEPIQIFFLHTVLFPALWTSRILLRFPLLGKNSLSVEKLGFSSAWSVSDEISI